MVVRAEVRGELLAWARDRSGLPADQVTRRFPKLPEWETGETAPTLKQLERFAQFTHTPVGFLFLEHPPDESVPIPDFRTMGDRPISGASPDLLDTVFICQQRQEWYHDFAQATREAPVSFAGSMTIATDEQAAAAAMRSALDFAIENRGTNWSDALRRLAEQAESLGILVMVSGVVGSNTHRKLDPREFRGFALADRLAPLVFVNGADTKAAQIFTLAHEVAHIWLGETALSDAEMLEPSDNDVERWCNRVAAELLVPRQAIEIEFNGAGDLTAELDRLARIFKVSTLVVLRRIHDVGRLERDEYRAAYRAELQRVLERLGESAGGGGNFYNTQPVRVSKRFARAVIVSTLEGQTLHRDAFRLLGFKKQSTFEALGQHLGVM